MMTLMKEYKETGDIELRNKLVEVNLKLVKFVVSKMCARNYYEYEFDDLVNYGIFGLVTAIEKFDLTKKTKFSTFAYQKIYFSIIDELRKVDWVPRSVRYKIRRASEEVKHVENAYGYEVDMAEIAKHHGLSRRDIEVMRGTCISSTDPIIDYIHDVREMKYDYVLC